MCDDDGGALFGNLVQRVEDFSLGAAVECAGRFVEDQDRRVFEQGARDRHPLFLATRQFEPAFADLRFILLRLGGDEIVNLRAACRILDFGLTGTFAAIADIVSDAVVEQHGILRDDADMRSQAGLRDVAQILPVDGDPPASHVVKTIEQPCDGRLARSRWPDDREGFARGNTQRQAVQYLPFRIIAEGHILERQFAA